MEAKELIKNEEVLDLIVYEGGVESVLEENPDMEVRLEDPVAARLLNGVRAAYNGYRELLRNLMEHLEEGS